MTTEASDTNHTAELRDFTVNLRVLTIAAMAVVIGVLSGFLALALMKLIGLFTNIFFFLRLDSTLVSPAGHRLGPFVILVPIIGALFVGLMARYGSEKIRGHGIPEAIESILLRGSRVEPRVAILKPLSAAISIGSGGPFGAEGPIIMTGGAFGSMMAQFFRLTSAERKTLLVAGAAGGMAATFDAPVAAVMLAVEVLLFEWKPRSFIPVAVSSAAAATMRHYLMGSGPLFPTAAHPAFLGGAGLGLCILAGLLAGILSTGLTQSIYFFEDRFHRLRIHWMWWPAIGAIAIGVGGYIFPQALGVGYDTIGDLLHGDVATKTIGGVLVVKWMIWAIALGSGTSGGVLAPILMIGGALGGIEGTFLPFEGAGFWPLISMGAVLGGTMRAPVTGVIFMVELTHDYTTLLPLLIATAVSYAFTTLVLKRSILTEKISRRGFHLSCEYSVDPLEILFVREVMRTNVVALPANMSPSEMRESLQEKSVRPQRFYPVVNDERRLVGVVTARDFDHVITSPVVAHPDEPLRMVVNRMAETGRTRLPVVDRRGRKLVGIVTLTNLLDARNRNLEEERRRERVLRLRVPFRRAPARVL